MIPAPLKSLLKKIRCYYPLLHFKKRLTDRLLIVRYRKKYPPDSSGLFLCNVCGNRYAKMLPCWPKKADEQAILSNQVIAGYGDNMICPGCLSTARERLVIAMLDHSITWKQKKILHFAPEKKIYDRICREAKVVTADLIPELYRPVDAGIKKENLTRISFPDDSFDLVIANHVLEHIPDDRNAICEIFRVLKSGGQAILQVPYSNQLMHTIEEPTIDHPERQSLLFGQHDHVRIYSLYDYLVRLREAGFNLRQISFQEMQDFHPFAIQPDEDFLWIEKP